MGGFSLIHWLILGVVVLLLFGGNRFSSMMGDVAKGLKSFKQGMADDDQAKDVRTQDPRTLPPAPPPTPFPNQQPPYGQQQGQQQQTIDLTPQPPTGPDPMMSPPRGTPPADDQAR